ncbi:hypothetical protein CW306_23070 [Bacillus sp. BA3]|uniref:hypothetical protein n=1 Tax=Bacillus sp. BA3 TaxID=2057910 RepID=UPI000C3279D2|nr:hypothetical protein [Bacillus sp. BA3]PKF86272.1 hypothetical protein CW306_23070 [Bacillus sp. BA3]
MADSRRKGSGFLKSTGIILNKKIAGKLALYVFLLFYESVIGLKKFATLLPKSWLAEMRRGDLADREQILKTTDVF